LTIDKKIRTDTILDPHYEAKDKFSFPPQFKEKQLEYKRPNYKPYSEFTKSFDRTTHKS